MYQSSAYIADTAELEDEVTRVFRRPAPPRVVTRRRQRALARLGMVIALIALVLVGVYTDTPTIPTASAKASLPTRGTPAQMLLGADPLVTALRRAYLPSPSVHLTTLGVDLDTTGLPLKLVPFGGISVGEPHRGRLYGGITLPENPSLYIVRRPEFAHGSTHAVMHLQIALAKFRQHSKYPGPLIVSDLSAPQGGRHWPHLSHQSGRDVDVWLPLLSDSEGVTLKRGNAATGPIDFEHFSAARPQEVDWDASWQLVKALVRIG